MLTVSRADRQRARPHAASGPACDGEVFFDGHRIVDLAAEDPEPLGGDRIAVWSHDCPIVVARFRVCGSGAAETEAPGTCPQTRSLY